MHKAIAVLIVVLAALAPAPVLAQFFYPRAAGHYPWMTIIEPAALQTATDADGQWQATRQAMVAYDTPGNTTGRSLTPQIGTDISKGAELLAKDSTTVKDFSGYNLNWMDLKGADLDNAVLGSTTEPPPCVAQPDADQPAVAGSLFHANLTAALLTTVKAACARFGDADMVGVLGYGADFTGADMRSIDARYGIFDGTTLRDAVLTSAKLASAHLNQVDAEEALFNDADLSGASLSGADLRGASFIDTTVTGTNLADADLSGAIYEAVGAPNIHTLGSARGFAALTYDKNPAALLDLRKQLTDGGFDGQARQLTYALKHRETQDLLSGVDRSNWLDRAIAFVQGAGQLVLFEWTTSWSIDGAHPLLLLICFIPIFALAYLVALLTNGSGHIVRSEKGDDGKDGPWTAVRLTWSRKLGRWPIWFALWFSIISAFRIGFREFSIGEWIGRMRESDTSYSSRGWVRSLSGLQSLVSFYMLALAILCIFGRPFG